jgi:hypothetical protein
VQNQFNIHSKTDAAMLEKNRDFRAVSSNSASNHLIFLKITTHMDP